MNTTISLLNKYMDTLAAHNYFNGAVLVGYKGEILLKKGYGLSSFQYDISNAPSTKFRIGSLTKSFTAMAIMKLYAKGALNLDDSIDTIFPDYQRGSEITIRHLLNHSSGIADFTSSPDYWTKTMRLPANLDEVIESFKEMPLEFDPGTEMSYSNSGYLVLTAIIEKASGISFADFLQKEIFDELGLAETGVDNGRSIVKLLAQGHTVWKEVIHTEHIDMSFPLGAYGMYSTVGDLYRWCQALISHSLIDKELQDQMFTSINGYGFGWFIEDGLQKEVSHFGDVNGFVNHLVVYPDDELVVVVLSNINITPVTQISRGLINIIFGKEIGSIAPFKPIEIESEHLVGTYLNGEETLSIHFDKELYAVVPKMYGVPYKFRLFPVEFKSKTIICKSNFIHDTYLFCLDERGIPHYVELIDSYGTRKRFVRGT